MNKMNSLIVDIILNQRDWVSKNYGYKLYIQTLFTPEYPKEIWNLFARSQTSDGLWYSAIGLDTSPLATRSMEVIRDIASCKQVFSFDTRFSGTSHRLNVNADDITHVAVYPDKQSGKDPVFELYRKVEISDINKVPEDKKPFLSVIK